MRKFKKVRVGGEFQKQMELMKPQAKRLHPGISYLFYNINQAIKKLHIYVLIGVAIFIAVFGLILIDSQFEPIQTPNEVYSKLTNLNHSCGLMAIIIFWMECVRMHRPKIYR